MHSHRQVPSRRHVVGTAALAALGLFASIAPLPASAQAWPTRPITIVVPFPAGGGTDMAIRGIQPQLQAELGQPVVVDNRAGAGGTIGSAYVAKATPDGYTAVLATTSTHAVSVSVYPKLPYDPLRDFVYAGFIGTSPYVLATNPSVAGKDVASLIATLKRNPQQYSFASVGAGTVSHLLGEQFKAYAGVPIVHVPYRGAAPAYTDLMGGQVQLMFDNPAGLVPYIRSGKLTAVATTAPNALLAGIPTFQQQGIANFTQSLWYGVAFPKGTPAPVVARFNQALNKVLADRAVSADFAAKGINARPGTPAELQAAVAADIPYWGRIAQAVGAKID
ncbi:tripartite tricarboxylate transporter substrate binding protein [Xylophilus sp. GOD-11R]|uniref:Bug family tripartite tricarboxylate transporter substrate binding protein n=1 Tax=Xylophilus sp. GOD-11R TaxID=3089814 RepID=UPI00298CD0E7|nr:tripartite tricarboxylate transporter substrate binding protein [Xylophilus sp. GOD-11R]WPB56314.1 tripartite tricarboxylate transporter substrate binding protein [Xylophilus sp. GOD-11R]